jgi:hypothetical protein
MPLADIEQVGDLAHRAILGYSEFDLRFSRVGAPRNCSHYVETRAARVIKGSLATSSLREEREEG